MCCCRRQPRNLSVGHASSTTSILSDTQVTCTLGSITNAANNEDFFLTRKKSRVVSQQVLRWESLVIRVGMDNDAFTNPTCGIQVLDELKYLLEASMTCLPPREAQYVSAHLQGGSFPLHLAEVMVFGVATHTTTPFVQTTASTTLYDWTSYSPPTTNSYGTTMASVDASHGPVATTTTTAVNDIHVTTVTKPSEVTEVKGQEVTQVKGPEMTDTIPSSVEHSDLSSNLLALFALFALVPIAMLVGLYIAKTKFKKRQSKKIKPIDNNIRVVTKTKIAWQSSAI